MVSGAIFVRAYRLLTVFRKAKDVTFSSRKVMTNFDLAIGVSVLLGLTLVVLTVWMIIEPPNQRYQVKIDVSGEVADNTITYFCDSSFPSSVFIITLIAIEALLFGFNCIVAALTQNLPSNFNESKHIAFTVTSTYPIQSTILNEHHKLQVYNGVVMLSVTVVLVIVFNDSPTTMLIVVALVSDLFSKE